MKKVLLITYTFPPINSVTGRFWAGIVSQMVKFGWEPFVLTTASEGDIQVPVDASHLILVDRHCDSGEKLVSAGQGYRGLSLLLKPIYFLYQKIGADLWTIDRFLFTWAKKALRDERIKTINPDVILATCYPFSAIWLGRHLSKRLKKPWIADFRDPASLWNTSKIKLLKSSDRFIDKLVVKSASLIITVGPSLAVEMEKLYQRPVKVVYNGSEKITIEGNSISKDKIIYYAGRFHPHRLPAVRLLIDWLANNPQKGFHLVLRSLGPEIANKEISEYAKSKNVKISLLTPADAKTITEEENNASCLVLFENLNQENPIYKGTITGKLFEYLCFQAPILAICRSDSDIGVVLKDTNRGMVVSSKEVLERAMADGLLFNANKERVRFYSQEKQAEVLCNLLNDVYGKK